MLVFVLMSFNRIARFFSTVEITDERKCSHKCVFVRNFSHFARRGIRP